MKLIRTNGHLSPAVASLLNDFFADRSIHFQPAVATASPAGIPPSNVIETGDAFRIEIAAPGLRRELFKVEFDDNLLTVSYIPQETDDTDKTATFVLYEFGHPGFERSFMLPKQKVDGGKIEARYAEGILIITVPKKEEMKRKPVRQISIL